MRSSSMRLAGEWGELSTTRGGAAPCRSPHPAHCSRLVPAATRPDVMTTPPVQAAGPCCGRHRERQLLRARIELRCALRALRRVCTAPEGDAPLLLLAEAYSRWASGGLVLHLCTHAWSARGLPPHHMPAARLLRLARRIHVAYAVAGARPGRAQRRSSSAQQRPACAARGAIHRARAVARSAAPPAGTRRRRCGRLLS